MKHFIIAIFAIIVVLNSTLFADNKFKSLKFTFKNYDKNSLNNKPKTEEEFINAFDSYFTMYTPQNKFNRTDDMILPNRFALNLPNILSDTYSTKITINNCNISSYISVSYPINTGNIEIDKVLKKIFFDIYSLTIEDAKKELIDRISVEDGSVICSSIRDISFISTFDIFSSRSGIFSIVISGNVDAGYFHPTQTYKSLNFNVSSLKEISLNDLFPNNAVGLKKLWPIVATRFCGAENSRNTIPFHYTGSIYREGDVCPPGGFKEGIPLPDGWTKPDVTFADFGDAVFFTPEGMVIFLGNYGAWGFANGSASVFVSKEELQKIGASAYIWE
jgi:hypothetical protein